MTRGPTISRPTLWSKADPLGPGCAPDPRLMAQWRVGCREPGGWAGTPVRTRGAEWAGEPSPGWEW